MPKSYPDEAREACLKLYLKFNGQQHDRIEREMRKAGWIGWSKQNLYSRGDKVGWIEKYGFEAALKLKLDTSETQAHTKAEELFLEIEQGRKRLKARLDADGWQTRDLVYQYQAQCRLSIEMHSKLNAMAGTYTGFAEFWEKLLDWLTEIDAPAAKALLRVADEILARAQVEYGEAENKPAT